MFFIVSAASADNFTTDKIDRSPADPPNLLCVVTDLKNYVYQLGTAAGIIKSWFNRIDFRKADSSFIKLHEVEKTKFISVREAVSSVSLFGGQGYSKCYCQPSKMQCRNNRCLCFKSQTKCGSRCHKSGPCANK